MRNIRDMIVLHAVTYLILFVIFPLCFPFALIPGAIVFFAVAVIQGTVFWRGQYRWWHRLVGTLLIWRLASWYHPKDVFDISEGDSFGLDWTSASFDAMVVCAVFFFLQTVLVLILKIIRWIKEKKENDTNVNG